MWDQLRAYENEKERTTNDSEKRGIERLIQISLHGIGQRGKSLRSLPEYKELIYQILEFPGLRPHFKASSLEIFLRGRLIEVNYSHLLATLLASSSLNMAHFIV